MNATQLFYVHPILYSYMITVQFVSMFVYCSYTYVQYTLHLTMNIIKLYNTILWYKFLTCLKIALKTLAESLISPKLERGAPGATHALPFAMYIRRTNVKHLPAPLGKRPQCYQKTPTLRKLVTPSSIYELKTCT